MKYLPAPWTVPLLAGLLFLGAAQADATTAVGSAVDSTGKAIVKAEKAVERGVKAGAEGLEHGAKVADQAARKVVKKAGLPSDVPASSAKRMPH